MCTKAEESLASSLPLGFVSHSRSFTHISSILWVSIPVLLYLGPPRRRSIMHAIIIFAGFLALVASAPISRLAPRGGVLDDSSPEELCGPKGHALGVTDTSVCLLDAPSGDEILILVRPVWLRLTAPTSAKP